MSSLQLSLILLSVNVKYQTSSNLHSVSQKLAHSQHKPTNKTEYSLFHIPLPIIGLTELFSIFFSIFANSKIPHVKSTQPSLHDHSSLHIIVPSGRGGGGGGVSKPV